jgi:uridine kinase
LAAASAAIANVAGSTSRVVLYEPLYERLARNADNQRIEHFVGPNDILIVEGVPALLMDDLQGLFDVMKVYVDVGRDTREIRLNQDYAWRGRSAEETFTTLASRELDEVPAVEQSKIHADFIIGRGFEGKNE